MQFHHSVRSGLWACCVLALAAATVRADAPKVAAAPPGRKAVERGLEFLVKDAAKWRAEKKCATCHHGTMTVWALTEATGRGFAVKPAEFAEVLKWTKERLDKIDQPRDTRPGWKMVNTPALYLSVMALCIPKQEAVSADELKRIAGHLLRHQEDDGSWAWSSAPPVNRPPPLFESDEVATLLGFMALGQQVPADPKAKSDARPARDKATAWLAKNPPTDTTQAVALKLLLKAQARGPTQALRADIDQLFARQNKDGGWGQLKGAHSDAYATGQTLYILCVAGVSTDRPEVRRAVTFLLSTQKDDGSWPMKRRGQPGVTPSANVWPITHLGTAWAALGLMRSG